MWTMNATHAEGEGTEIAIGDAGSIPALRPLWESLHHHDVAVAPALGRVPDAR